MQIVACLFSAIGGLLFGLDLGYMSGILAMASFQHDVNSDGPLDDATTGAVTAVFSLGAVISSFPPVAGAFVAGLGRKGAIVFGALLFTAGALLQGTAGSLGPIYSGRIISGAAVGLLSVNVPLYQSELAQPHLRGSMVALYQLAITAGIMASFWLNYAVESVPGGWRISVLLQVPSAQCPVPSAQCPMLRLAYQHAPAGGPWRCSRFGHVALATAIAPVARVRR